MLKRNPELIGITFLTLALIAGVVSGAIIRRDKISPIGVGYHNPTLVNLSAAQVDRATPAVRLINSLTDSSQSPCYDSYHPTEPCDQQTSDVPLELRRNADTGDVLPSQFFRFQGKFSYTEGLGDNWKPVSSLGMRPAGLPGPTQLSVLNSYIYNGRACFNTWGNPDPVQGRPVEFGGTRCSSGSSSTAFDYTGYPPASPPPEMTTSTVPSYQADGAAVNAQANWVQPSSPSCLQTRWPQFPGGCYAPTEIARDYNYWQNINVTNWRLAQRFFSTALFKGDIYAATFSHGNFARKVTPTAQSLGFQIWQHHGAANNPNSWTPTSTAWKKVVTGGSGNRNNEGVFYMFVNNDILFASVYNSSVTNTATKLMYSSNGTNWNTLTVPQASSSQSYVSGSVLWQGKLFLNVTGDGLFRVENPTSAPSSWTWTKITSVGGGYSNSIVVNTISGVETLFFVGVKNNKPGIYKITRPSCSNSRCVKKSRTGISPVETLQKAGNSVYAGLGLWFMPRGSPDTYGELPRAARVMCFGECSPNVFVPKITIKLPPRLIFKPDQLLFEDEKWRFDLSDSNNPVEVHQSGPNDYVANIILKDQGDGDNRGKYYEVTITGFDSREEEYNYRLTLVPSASGSDIANIGSYLEQSGAHENVYLGSGECAGGLQEYICFNTDVIVEVPEILENGAPLPISLGPPMREKISVADIRVGGNVLAPGEIADFEISDSAVVVGGSINIRGNPAKLPNYSSSEINWSSVRSILQASFDKGFAAGTAVGGNYTGAVWHLNSATNDPLNLQRSTYSTPPEGKVWKVAGNLTLNNSVQFDGIGSIVVDGNVTVRGDIGCTKAKLAIIASGTITFETPANHTETVECGAYVALGGSITFGDAYEGDVKGIFVARSSIDLPSRVPLTHSYSIDYDADLAANPPGLLRDILQIVFGAKS
ncbi:hypothetical protein A3A71_02700 [Candidatus Berkelbacteria bacterium RIFCSPLOWO2_01_FULL_50_28]|uniref:Uncharacterized protein n=1 Tax=Candidatus Berkelbacteria bacterium RIFCSPLOWO2_01_FULL_50_28 TaxID=1797471 RepID=A0A1F5EC51_9BACT|nr:MAG: hypothetical protein A2807_02190 [Candidatus Berkelbacteria bacterium RIFCSPHIGHO2_01_FULL_50_36]OGD62619.1 MAG: hypothetical protein A3F39_02780 [Candidatus Berkelbacteria bacterium RIFCSPHIGHO2_12_FULL_50_11]OGD64931.1 MAG: hypothetical protein A3A71_02700 [Candidatus Berkelbacteria bacterium RIFCSPLOWO2_01_FULL_50_28]